MRYEGVRVEIDRDRFCCEIYVVSYQNKRFNFTRLASKNWKTTNLEILKFEARFAYAVKFWPDFFD